MSRLAIFVEGQTERLFVLWLLEVLGGKAMKAPDQRRASGGRRRSFSRQLFPIAGAPRPDGEFDVLLVQCGGDTRVASDIQDQYATLCEQGYDTVLGVRDVAPEVPHADIPRLRAGLNASAPKGAVRVDFILAVMEIEAWFITEHTHFEKLDPGLTADRIADNLGFDPRVDDIGLRPTPAEDLGDCYGLVGEAYGKDEATVQRTIDLLDAAQVRGEAADRTEDLRNLLDHLDRVFPQRAGSES